MTDLLKREDALIAFDVVCRYRTPHVSTLEKGIRTLPAAEAEVESDVLLDAKTKAADMIPLSERSEEHTSELQSLMRISYAVFCVKNKYKDIQLQTTK